jgi:tRNA(fMet)-specific endonuclease VapC
MRTYRRSPSSTSIRSSFDPLDTNIIADLVRNPKGDVAERIRAVGQTAVCTSIIVAAEVRYGAAKKGSPRLSAQVEAILGALEVLPFEVPADAVYGRLRADMEHAGRPIGANDLLIAAHALALDHTLVTANDREFARIDDLRRETWPQ